MEKDQFPIRRVLSEDGDLLDSNFDYANDEEWVRSIYEDMLLARTFDRKCVSLQRQGRIGTYAPFEGQEAAQIGSARVLEKEDWLFPTYRDHGASLTFGQSMVTTLLYWNGRYEGAAPPANQHIFPPAVPIASQLLHATGVAWAEKKKGTDRLSLVYFGDGATSEGDFHEALNFASVFQIPVIFFNQNNGFAISVPFEKQTHASTIAQKALGYDMEGIRVDGNDVFGVYQVMAEAATKARQGGGPTLIEALTWRYGAHTTSDDPRKYRDQSESERRRTTQDPLLRVEQFMRKQGMWDSDLDHLEEKVVEKVEAAVRQFEQFPKKKLEHLFDFVYEKAPWPIQEQKQSLLSQLGGGTHNGN